MIRNAVTQVIEQMGRPVDLNDFVSCGRLRATEVGLARCQSEPLVAVLQIIGKDLRKKKNSREQVLQLSNEMLAITVLMVCSNAEWTTSMTDDEGGEFLAKNRTPIARLIFAAYLTGRPAAKGEKQC